MAVLVDTDRGLHRGLGDRTPAGHAPLAAKRQRLKFSRRRADLHSVTEGSTKAYLDNARKTAIVGKLYERAMEHIPTQYERQGGNCAGCGRALPSPADGLLRLDGDLECITCNLKGHHPVN